MIRFITTRVGLAVLSVWGVVTIVFFLTKLIPGDAAIIYAGSNATAQQLTAAREFLGLDRPVLQQYVMFLGRVLRGDLGHSASTHQAVSADLAVAVPTTLQLVVVTMLFTMLIAVPLGTIAAALRDKSPDVAARIFFVLAGGVPVFWLAVMLQWILATNLGWFPISGANTIGEAPPRVTGASMLDSIIAGDAAAFADSFEHLVLPALALAAPFLSTIARNVRSSVIGALDTDYVALAVAKGASPGRVVVGHALRSTMGSTLTLLGMQLGWMMGAAILVESVFAIPGVGTYLSKAVLNQDTFSLLGCVLVIGIVFAVTSLAVDLLHIWTDPRVRRSQLTGAGH